MSLEWLNLHSICIGLKEGVELQSSGYCTAVLGMETWKDFVVMFAHSNAQSSTYRLEVLCTTTGYVP